MPNWLHLFTNLTYHLGLALWVGGSVALGALVAPQLFRALPREQAGGIFGQTLRRFARLRVGALVATLAAAAMKFTLWERTPNVWMAIRWAALLFMAAAVLYEITHLQHALESRRLELTPGMEVNDPRRGEFNRLHKRAETLLKASVVAAVVAMLLS